MDERTGRSSSSSPSQDHGSGLVGRLLVDDHGLESGEEHDDAGEEGREEVGVDTAGGRGKEYET